jgi:hypothetical protein
MKEMTIKKNQTLGELALGAIDAFEINMDGIEASAALNRQL